MGTKRIISIGIILALLASMCLAAYAYTVTDYVEGLHKTVDQYKQSGQKVGFDLTFENISTPGSQILEGDLFWAVISARGMETIALASVKIAYNPEVVTTWLEDGNGGSRQYYSDADSNLTLNYLLNPSDTLIQNMRYSQNSAEFPYFTNIGIWLDDKSSVAEGKRTFGVAYGQSIEAYGKDYVIVSPQDINKVVVAKFRFKALTNGNPDWQILNQDTYLTVSADQSRGNLAYSFVGDDLDCSIEGILAAAPTPTPTPTPAPVDKDALGEAIINAEDFYNYVVLESIGNLEGQYTQAVANALNSALAAANGVYYDYWADQATVDQAISDLNAAVAATVPNPATPTPEPTPTPTPEPQGVKVSGYTDAVGATVTLAEGVTIAADEAGYFEFTGVAAGSYSLAIAKQYHVTRTIAITVADSDVAIGTSANKIEIFKGDFTEDGSINVSDYQVFMLSYNKSTGADGFNPEADFTGDGSVNVSDYQVFMLSYNKSAANYTVV